MIEWCQHALQIAAIGRYLKCQCTLPWRWQAVFRFDQGADAMLQTQPVEACGSQNDGGVFTTIELAQTRIKVAAQGFDHQLRITRRNQRLTAQAAGADHSAGRQDIQPGVIIGDKGIARIFALQDAGQRKTWRQLHRHILQTVHRKIGPASAMATSNSLTNKPLPPTLESVRSKI